MSQITADSIKAVIASYWRYVRQCPVIALEVNSNLSSYSGEETADVLAVAVGEGVRRSRALGEGLT